MRANAVLSADNVKPDRFALMDALRRAAPSLPFGPSVIATVDALLSCLPPKRNHDVVFASNATLVMRRNGISDRTLRRHLADLVDAGMVRRVDSPNGKRYARHDRTAGTVLRFGLDLSPLFALFDRLAALAEAERQTAERVAYLRCKLRAAIATGLADAPLREEASRALRRKLAVAELERWLDRLTDAATAVETRNEGAADASDMSASNGQNVRHQRKSKKENTEEREQAPDATAQMVTPDELAHACPQATALLTEDMRSERDVVSHARRLAPMIGIDGACYDAAEARHGPVGAALTVWGLLEMLDRVQKPAAYFRAITTGPRSIGFDPATMIARLLARARRGEGFCPRTMDRAMAGQGA